MKLALALALCACALPAFAQEGRYVDPQPVNFDRPFLYEGLRPDLPGAQPIRGTPDEPRAAVTPIPIEVWLRNGRTLKGLQPERPATSMNLDAEALQGLFKDLLPAEKAPAPSR